MLEQNEFQQFVMAPANARYDYFIQRVTKSREVWVVLDSNNQIKLAGDEENKLVVPVWPFKESAQRCLEGNMEDCKVISISLEQFMDKVLLDMKKQGVPSSVFWNGRDTAIIDVDQLLFDLNWELSKNQLLH
ncbi:DUF2750 domain-containing protein [Metabacillus iocasae]|uniref:DUF2750 domain-containing protein n=1 Tax=Priestia iocasae TaxID=2291674 RepID=A0ABS2QRM6_9BACI|nr:DUF2750 domain-containing protein [Metabacillus iocasae]MBM7702115.1 hypothetical protein [Metabacillus iocasae]